MARRRATSRPMLVGIAVAAPALRRAVIGSLVASGRYEAVAFEPPEIEEGIWPRRRFAAVVATPRAFRARQRRVVRGRAPVILVVREADIAREKTVLGLADAFVLADRLDLLPSLVVLSRDQLSILPRPRGAKSSRRAAGRLKATK